MLSVECSEIRRYDLADGGVLEELLELPGDAVLLGVRANRRLPQLTDY